MRVPEEAQKVEETEKIFEEIMAPIFLIFKVDSEQRDKEGHFTTKKEVNSSSIYNDAKHLVHLIRELQNI